MPIIADELPTYVENIYPYFRRIEAFIQLPSNQITLDIFNDIVDALQQEKNLIAMQTKYAEISNDLGALRKIYMGGFQKDQTIADEAKIDMAETAKFVFDHAAQIVRKNVFHQGDSIATQVGYGIEQGCQGVAQTFQGAAGFAAQATSAVNNILTNPGQAVTTVRDTTNSAISSVQDGFVAASTAGRNIPNMASNIVNNFVAEPIKSVATAVTTGAGTTLAAAASGGTVMPALAFWAVTTNKAFSSNTTHSTQDWKEELLKVCQDSAPRKRLKLQVSK